MKRVWIVITTTGFIIGVFDSEEKAWHCAEKNPEPDKHLPIISVHEVN